MVNQGSSLFLYNPQYIDFYGMVPRALVHFQAINISAIQTARMKKGRSILTASKEPSRK